MPSSFEFDEKIYSLQTAARGWYDRTDVEVYFRKRSKWYQWHLLSALPADRHAPIVDFGCGAGNFLYFLKEHGYTHSFGIDSDPNMVKLGKDLGLSITLANAVTYIDTLPDKPAVITCFDFLEHLEKPDAVTFIEKALAALPANGTLLIRVPCADGILSAHDWANDLTHKWVATTNVWRNLLHGLGCRSVRFIDEVPAPTNIVQSLRFVAAKIMRPILTFGLLLAGLPRPTVHSTSVTIVAVKG